MQSIQPPINLLLVAESTEAREYFQYLLSEVKTLALKIDATDNVLKGLEQLVLSHYDCAVIDYNIPGKKAEWLAQEIKRRSIDTVPVLLGGGDTERLVPEAKLCGIQGYAGRFEISAAMLEKCLHSALASNAQQLQNLADMSLDTMKQLRSYEDFRVILGGACARAERFNRHFALFYLDLDELQKINERYGYAAGDKALQTLVAQISLCTRQYDTLARVAGDQFVLLLEELEGDGLLPAIRIAKRIREQLEATAVDIGTLRIPISASIGISLYPQNGSEAEQLVEFAEMAMLVAKRTGGAYYIAESVSAQEQHPERNWRVIN